MKELDEASRVFTGRSLIHTLTGQLAELYQDHHYTPGLVQGVAIGNDCSH